MDRFHKLAAKLRDTETIRYGKKYLAAHKAKLATCLVVQVVINDILNGQFPKNGCQ
jgi:hypothetical protein